MLIDILSDIEDCWDLHKRWEMDYNPSKDTDFLLDKG
jgi:hypothetical protein